MSDSGYGHDEHEKCEYRYAVVADVETETWQAMEVATVRASYSPLA